ncbi:exostosin domain-containing protein [Coraliomargarita sp. W4R72]
MTLEEYQRGAGIPIEEQILLVENQDFFQSCFHLDMTDPKRLRVPIGEVRKWCFKWQVFLRNQRLNIKGIGPKVPILVSNRDGRIEKLKKLQLVADRLQKKRDHRVIVLGKSDLELSDELLQVFAGLDVHVFGNNLNTKNPRASYFPMGRDFRGRDCHSIAPSHEKTDLVYCNFSLNTHSIRPQIWEQLKKMRFICSEHMGSYQNYQLTHRQFYEQLRKSKFCVAPRGNAIETFRMWDSLYVGTIPIVVREAVFHKELEDLPILFLENYEQFSELSEERLEAIYSEMMQGDWNYTKLRAEYWRERITDRTMQV